MKKIFTVLFIFMVIIMTGCYKKDNDNEQPDISDIVIKDSGWSYIESDTGKYISYGVEIYNPSKNSLVKSPIIKVIGKNDNNDIVFTYDDTLSYISQTDTIYFGKTTKVNDKPSKLEITIEYEEDNYILEKDIDNIKNSDLEIFSTKEIVKDNIRQYTGEIKNNSSIDLSKLIVSVIYKKDNKIVGGSYSYVYSAKSGDSLEFDVYTVNTPDYDEYDIKVTSGDNIN